MSVFICFIYYFPFNVTLRVIIEDTLQEVWNLTAFFISNFTNGNENWLYVLFGTYYFDMFYEIHSSVL